MFARRSIFKTSDLTPKRVVLFVDDRRSTCGCFKTQTDNDMLNWHTTPVSIQHAIKFVMHTNDARHHGVEIDTAQVLANKVAVLCCRSYFARLLTAIDSGELDPVSLDEWKQLASGTDDGEESSEEDDDETDADRRCNDGTY
jgi:hypothetical protein